MREPSEQSAPVVISANAKGVMMEFYDRVSPSPDPAALQVMSAVLSLDKDVISHFFQNEQRRRKLTEQSRDPFTPEDTV